MNRRRVAGVVLRRIRLPQATIAHFAWRRALKGAVIVGVGFGLLVVVQAFGYTATYKTAAERQQFASSLGNNPGLTLLYGHAHHIETPAGYTEWRTLEVASIIGGIWALLASTKMLRGQEENGSWELLVAGQTTRQRATLGAIAGMFGSLVLAFVGVAAGVALAARAPDMNVGLGSGLLFALTLLLGAAMFLSIGALASQCTMTRRRAAGLSLGLLAIFFGLRVVGDIVSGLAWLRDVTPLGWIENATPLSGSRAWWLLPVAAFTAAAWVASVRLSGRRDLGASVLPEKDTARPRTRLLGSPLGAAVRLNRLTLGMWVVGILLVTALISSVAKSAADTIANSGAIAQTLARFAGQSGNARSAIIAAFFGAAFFMSMIILMSMVVAGVHAMRQDEAEGYLDNFLVRAVSRTSWLGGRVLLLGATVAIACVLSGVTAWVVAHAQHVDIGFGTLWKAGLNSLAPAICILGICVGCLGLWPRLIGAVGYGLIVWAFVIDMVRSVVHLNHWVLDTSILHHVALAPAVSPDWRSDAVLVAVGAACAAAGWIRFRVRDLVSA